MKHPETQDIINILFDRYNDGLRFTLPEQAREAQAFITKIINEGITGDEDVEFNHFKLQLSKIMKCRSKKYVEQVASFAWLNYGPKINKV